MSAFGQRYFRFEFLIVRELILIFCKGAGKWSKKAKSHNNRSNYCCSAVVHMCVLS